MNTRENRRLLKSLGKRIRELRKQQGISQAQLGLECGVHGEYIGRIERGLQSPTFSLLDNISKSFNITIAELLKDF